jgi:hypothetical protein
LKNSKLTNINKNQTDSESNAIDSNSQISKIGTVNLEELEKLQTESDSKVEYLKTELKKIQQDLIKLDKNATLADLNSIKINNMIFALSKLRSLRIEWRKLFVYVFQFLRIKKSKKVEKL